MPRSNHEHRIAEVCYRGPWLIACQCGFVREWSAEDLEAMEFGGIYEEIENTWLLHRREYGLTSK